jgi:hypothetical protein
MESQASADTSKLDNDAHKAPDKLDDDESAVGEGSTAPQHVEIQVALEEVAKIEALVSTGYLPKDPKEGQGYQIGKDYWINIKGKWVTQQGVRGFEDFAANPAGNEAARAKTIDAFHIDPASGASKRFVISGFNAETNPAAEPNDCKDQLVILFQNGVVPEVGVNGVTPEDVLKVLVALFEGYQTGPFACERNAKVLFNLEGAIANINARTEERAERGVEGTHQL